MANNTSGKQDNGSPAAGDQVIQTSAIGHNVNVTGDDATVTIGNVDLVITNLSSSDLATYTKELLQSINHRDFERAETYQTALASVNSVDDECKTLLKLLSYKLEFYRDIDDIVIDKHLFFDLLQSERSSPLIRDIVESIFIHYLSTSSTELARQRYENSTYRGSYTDEVFFERVATLEELTRSIEASKDHYEYELSSLVRGAIRCGEFNIAVSAARSLLKQYPNQNSKILLAYASALEVHEQMEGKHFWLIDSELMGKLENCVNECLSLAKYSQDFRIVQIAALLSAATWFQHTELLDLCAKNIDKAKAVVPRIQDLLAQPKSTEGAFSSAPEVLNKSKLELNETEFLQLMPAIFEERISDREIREWLGQGGQTAITINDNTNKLAQLFLCAVACDADSRKQKQELSDLFDRFNENNNVQTEDFSILLLPFLCLRLKKADLHLHIVRLLEPLLPRNPWANPLLDCYAEALLASDQLDKLSALLNRIPTTTESPKLHAVKIESTLLSGEPERAMELTESALAEYPNSCYYWAILLRNLYHSNCSSAEVKSAISRIPKAILKEYSEEGFRLLTLIAKNELILAESFILEWFIDDPTGMATLVTNLHLNNLRQDSGQETSAITSLRCREAVVYAVGNKVQTKLLVDNCGGSEYLLDTDTPLGRLFQNAEAGEEVEAGFITYKIIEKTSPMVGAFRISANIRNDTNPGNDCFYQISVEGGGITGILQQIEAMSKQKQIIESEIEGKAIPLLMRLAQSHKNELVKGAFLYLCDRESNKKLRLFAGGDTIKESVILDVLSLAYLSITGLCHGLTEMGIRFYITKETHNIVSSWLEQTESPDYLAIGQVDGAFIKTTAKEIANDKNIGNLRFLFDKCESLPPKSIDMPEIMIKLKDSLDISHYSSIRLAISREMPFLCIDADFCFLYQSLGLNTANAYQLMLDAKHFNKTDSNRHLECHVQLGLAVPVMHRDVIELCSQSESGQFLAVELIKLHADNYDSPQLALRVLTECCLKAIESAFFNHRGQIDLSEWRYTTNIVYACCESAMNSLEGRSCEQRLALLIYMVLISLESTDNISNFAVALFQQFSRGHFLDIKQINIELASLAEQRNES